MNVELRRFAGGKILLILLPSKDESKLIDLALGDRPFDEDGKGPAVMGNVRLSDGFNTHYILLERAE